MRLAAYDALGRKFMNYEGTPPCTRYTPSSSSSLLCTAVNAGQSNMIITKKLRSVCMPRVLPRRGVERNDMGSSQQRPCEREGLKDDGGVGGGGGGGGVRRDKKSGNLWASGSSRERIRHDQQRKKFRPLPVEFCTGFVGGGGDLVLPIMPRKGVPAGARAAHKFVTFIVLPVMRVCPCRTVCVRPCA